MIDLKKTQKAIYDNKVKKGFNTTDVKLELLRIHGEVTEAFEAWHKGKDDFNEELADVAIYLLGLAEILHIDLEKEIKAKMEKNAKRKYKIVNGAARRIKEANE